ncbi:uncharacterized protein [Eurosta solidaginis]|uniref:uncharacterized protein n=1 Tax=Eurosta solidaginis TaxID=178769 RepID=UPI0035308A6D
MAPWSWRNPCTSGSTDSSDESSESPSPIRKRAQQRLPPSNNIGAANSLYQNPNFNATTKYITPVLFSTNRGLHLRVAKTMSKSHAAAVGAYGCPNTEGNSGEVRNKCSCGIIGGDCGNENNLPTANYDNEIHFCDLERWSTNRANTISLEDTFIVSRRKNSLPSTNGSSYNENSGILNDRMQRGSSIFYVPSGSRHALVMPPRSLYERSTSIQSNFERFGVL